MQQYKDKQELIDEINGQAGLFINEFYDINEKDKDKIIIEVDRTPAQMIAYQLGWMNLLLNWECEEQKGNNVITPAPNYKWNNLGILFQEFYKQYEKYSLKKLCDMFNEKKDNIIDLISNYTHEELFETGKRKWASSTPSNWPICKWIHINTVAPFKSFRTKIKKWKKLNN